MRLSLILFCLFFSVLLRAGNQDTTCMRMFYHTDFLLFSNNKVDGFACEKQHLSLSNSINFNFLNSRHFVLSLGVTMFSLSFLNIDSLDYINMKIFQTRLQSNYWGPTIGFKYYNFSGRFGYYTFLRLTGYLVPGTYSIDSGKRFQVNSSLGAGALYSVGRWNFGLGLSTCDCYIEKINKFKTAPGITAIIGLRFLKQEP